MYQVHGSRRRARDLVADQISGRNPAGDCMSPVEVRYRGAPDEIMVGLGLEKESIAVAYFGARCRKCDTCLAHRKRLWTARAIAECAVADRSWFGTLTFRPETRVRYLYQAQLRHARSTGDSWHELDETETFGRIVTEITPEITKFLKRIRASSGAVLRYLLVSEAHEDGFPHFHLLVHEFAGKVTKRELDAAWRDGFSQFRLIPVGDPRGARYACKYLSKSALTRVRASQRYGQPQLIARLVAERLEGVNGLLRAAHKADPGKNDAGLSPRDEGAPQRSEETEG